MALAVQGNFYCFGQPTTSLTINIAYKYYDMWFIIQTTFLSVKEGLLRISLVQQEKSGVNVPHT